MRNTFFQFLRAIACSTAVLFLTIWLSIGGSYASAQAPTSFQLPSSFFSPLKMPRYEQWRKLSPEAQSQFIMDVQAFLLRADAVARAEGRAQSSHEAQVIQHLFELWVETAQAKPRARSRAPQQPYCINQGVVKPLSQCDTSLGYKMHDFDTNELLSKLGPASKCPAGEKPCSPFYGFTAEGQMHCSSLNLTRDCAQKSTQPGTITLANTLMACEKGSPGVPKVDCKALQAFFDQQMDAVDKLCQNAPKRFACSILKEQIKEVVAEKSEKSAAVSAVGAEAIAEIPAKVNELVQMEEGSAPCLPDTPVKPAPAPEPKAACVKKPYPTGLDAPVLDAIARTMIKSPDEGFTCGEVGLPNQGKFKLDIIKGEVVFQASANSASVTVDETGFKTLIIASNILLKGFKVAPKDLLASYLPKEAIQDAGKINELSATGWVSVDGTRLRYAEDEKTNTLLLAIKRPGQAKEVTLPIPLKSEAPEGQSADEAPAEAPKAAKDSRAAAPQPK